MNTLAWFFFKLFVFGYVEDLETGIAFRLPGGLTWRIYIEVFFVLRTCFESINFSRNFYGNILFHVIIALLLYMRI